MARQKRSAHPDGNIEGVYNYCDRWCERCPFTSRCASFALGRRIEEAQRNGDDLNRVFWEELMGDSEDEAGNEGWWVDTDEFESPSLPTFEEQLEQRLRDEAAENHECAVRADQYMHAVDAWQEDTPAISFTDDGQAVIEHGVVAEQAREQSIDAADAFMVVWFYHMLIYVKLRRALHGRDSEIEDMLASLDPDEEQFPRDSDGSAKIALIAMDRSLAAWRLMLRAFPSKKDSIAQFLLMLSVLRRKVEEEFPEARAFVRPGFDTGK